MRHASLTCKVFKAMLIDCPCLLYIINADVLWQLPGRMWAYAVGRWLRRHQLVWFRRLQCSRATQDSGHRDTHADRARSHDVGTAGDVRRKNEGGCRGNTRRGVAASDRHRDAVLAAEQCRRIVDRHSSIPRSCSCQHCRQSTDGWGTQPYLFPSMGSRATKIIGCAPFSCWILLKAMKPGSGFLVLFCIVASLCLGM